MALNGARDFRMDNPFPSGNPGGEICSTRMINVALLFAGVRQTQVLRFCLNVILSRLGDEQLSFVPFLSQFILRLAPRPYAIL